MEVIEIVEVSALMWQEGWKPTTDQECSQLMRHLGEKRRETERVSGSAKAEIEALEEIARAAEDKLISLESKIGALLREYVQNEVDTDELNISKTQVKYKLARGEIVIAKKGFKLEKPTDTSILESLYPHFTKSETSLKWGELKKTLEITDTGLVIEKNTGAVVDISPSEVPETVTIKLTI